MFFCSLHKICFYTFSIDVPVRYNLGGEHVTVDQPNYNLYVRVIDTQAPEKMEDGWYKIIVKIEIKTLKDGRIREKILLTNTEDTQKQMEVIYLSIHPSIYLSVNYVYK